jgi:Rod binding domain-containing protein
MTLPLSALPGAQTAAPSGATQVDPQALKAAKDFEAIFLRTLLSSLEKTTSVSGGGKLSASQSNYGSMVVGALSDSISQSGGIGLADLVAKSLTLHSGREPTDPKISK